MGFSWSLPHQMVLRGGYGLAFYPNNKNAGAYMKNPPFTANYGPVNSNAAASGIPNMFLKDGLPPVVFANPSQPTGNVIGTSENFKSDRSQQFNILLEKEFAGNVVTGGYIGYRADRLILGVAKNYNIAPAGPGNVNARRPYAAQYPAMANVNIFRTSPRRNTTPRSSSSPAHRAGRRWPSITLALPQGRSTVNFPSRVCERSSSSAHRFG